ncbi:MAG TPA: hypothetical protein PKY82_08265 [Pyrinomonadaceae bacterium]|nr:hypothetical protein [Pyrinomonadaceae bacterium]
MNLFIAFCLFFLMIGLFIFVRRFRFGRKSKEIGYPTNCHVCGKPSVSWNKYFCSFECEAQLAQNMPDWYKRLDMD